MCIKELSKTVYLPKRCAWDSNPRPQSATNPLGNGCYLSISFDRIIADYESTTRLQDFFSILGRLQPRKF